MKTKYFIIIFCLMTNLLLGNTEKEINENVEKYISKLPGSDKESLINMIRDGRKYMKRAAVERLGNLRSTEAEDILIAAMTYTWAWNNFDKKYLTGKKKLIPELDEEVRAEAALSLGKLRDSKNIYAIGNTIMVDKSSMVKQYCLRALGLINKQECVQYIEKAIKYELSLNKNLLDNNVVITAIKALGSIRHKDGFSILIEVTQNEKLDPNIKNEALETLEKIRWDW